MVRRRAGRDWKVMVCVIRETIVRRELFYAYTPRYRPLVCSEWNGAVNYTFGFPGFFGVEYLFYFFF